MKKIYLIASIEFTVNTFLLSHLKMLLDYYDITVLVCSKKLFNWLGN